MVKFGWERYQHVERLRLRCAGLRGRTRVVRSSEGLQTVRFDGSQLRIQCALDFTYRFDFAPRYSRQALQIPFPASTTPDYPSSIASESANYAEPKEGQRLWSIKGPKATQVHCDSWISKEQSIFDTVKAP